MGGREETELVEQCDEKATAMSEEGSSEESVTWERSDEARRHAIAKQREGTQPAFLTPSTHFYVTYLSGVSQCFVVLRLAAAHLREAPIIAGVGCRGEFKRR